MKIAFLLGSPGISGGTYVIYEHASRLKRKGYQVAIITRQEVQPEEHAWHSSAGELDWLTIRQARIECFDIIFATWWETIFLLRKIKAVHYAYFVQSIESRFFEQSDLLNPHNTKHLFWRSLCNKTYSYAVPMITEARWIQEYIHQHYNNWPQLVRNGIRKDIYTREGEAINSRQSGRFRVLVEGPVEVFFKNVPTALRLARQAEVDEVWLLTSSALQEHPDADRVFSQVPIHETPTIYRSCDLVLKLSYVEGMFGPPLEMFHCGGTALVYDVTGYDEYIIHNQNAYVVATDDEEEVVRLLRYLKKNPAELIRLKESAINTAAAWPDWEDCADQFEQAVLNITAGKASSQKYLQSYTRELFRSKKPFLRAAMQNVFSQREKADWQGTDTAQHNFVRFFWDSQGKFTDEQSQHQHYLSGEWVDFSFTLQVKDVPLWLRLDPSIHIGIVEIASITVRNKTQNRTIMLFVKQEEFQTLFLAKDLKWIFSERKDTVFIYGLEPIILFPTVKEKDAVAGDLLEFSIKLKETGLQQLSSIRNEVHNIDCEKNVMLLQWDNAGNFNKKRSLLRRYPQDDWTTISFFLHVKEPQLWLRLDLSHHLGILEIEHITVQNKTQDRLIMTFQKEEELQTLFLTGDLQWLFPEQKNIFFVSGPEPILLLPALQQEDAVIDDQLEITVRLRESSISQFFARYQVSLADRSAPRWKRVIQLINGQI